MTINEDKSIESLAQSVLDKGSGFLGRCLTGWDGGSHQRD